MLKYELQQVLEKLERIPFIRDGAIFQDFFEMRGVDRLAGQDSDRDSLVRVAPLSEMGTHQTLPARPRPLHQADAIDGAH